jgi:hypothetical protein
MSNSALRRAKTAEVPFLRFQYRGKNGEEKLSAIYPA